MKWAFATATIVIGGATAIVVAVLASGVQVRTQALPEFSKTHIDDAPLSVDPATLVCRCNCLYRAAGQELPTSLCSKPHARNRACQDDYYDFAATIKDDCQVYEGTACIGYDTEALRRKGVLGNCAATALPDTVDSSLARP